MPADGRRDFDFVHGEWQIAHRSLVDRTDPGCDQWAEFAGTAVAQEILGGLGNFDRIVVPSLDFEGCSLRVFDPATDVWRIFWTSTATPGRVDAPVEGRFEDGVGRFEGTDQVAGRPVRIRFEWKDITPASARWEQFFSWDGGAVWKHNWTMEWTRAGQAT